MAAFGAVALMTVAASAVAWFSYLNIDRTFSQVTETTVPAMTRALRIAAESASLSAAAPALAAVGDAEERAAALAALEARMGALADMIAELEAAAGDGDSLAKIRRSVGDLETSLRTLDESVAARLVAAETRKTAVAEAARLHGEALTLLETLVDDANFNLTMSAEQASSNATEVINTLMGEGVDTMRQALELQSDSNLVAGLLTEAANAADIGYLHAGEDRFTAAARRLEDTLAALPEDQSLETPRLLAGQLLELGRGDGGLFALRERELNDTYEDARFRREASIRRRAVENEVTAAHRGLLEALAPIIDDANFNLVIGGETATTQNAGFIDTLVNEGMVALRAMLEVQSEANLIAGLLSEGANVLEGARVQPLRERFTAAKVRLEEAFEALPQDDEIAALGGMIEGLIALGAGAGNVFDGRFAELRSVDRAEAVLAETRQLSERLADVVDRLVVAAEADVTSGTGQVSGAIAAGMTWLAALALASLLGAGLIAWLYVGRNLLGRLTRLAQAQRRLAAGDLNTEIPAGGSDELAEMAKTLIVFRDGLAEVEAANARAEAEREKSEKQRRASMMRLADEFEQSVKTVVEGVAMAAGDMQWTAKAMSATAEETSQQAVVVAGASDQATHNVQAVAGAAEKLAESISEIGRQVSDTTEIAGEAAEKARQGNRQVEQLAEAAGRIGAVVSLIQDIAEQTNLLALNATIEAARAGEAGKGFAVVASEVKALANQTAKATEEIAQQIGNIQAATGDTVSVIQSITDTIGRVNEIATSVASAVEEQSAATQQISDNVQEVATGTREVSTTISSVKSAAGDTGQAANQVLKSAEDLAEQSESLRSQVEQFLTEVRAA